MTTTAAGVSASAMSAAHAAHAPVRVAVGYTAVGVAAKGAGVDAALPVRSSEATAHGRFDRMRCGVILGSSSVARSRPAIWGACARPVCRRRTVIEEGRPARNPRRTVVVKLPSMPIEAPRRPSPSVAAPESDVDPNSKTEVRMADPYRTEDEARPDPKRRTVDRPGIVNRHIDVVRIRGLNDHVWSVVGDGLLGVCA